MDWNQELLASVVWLAKAFVISLLGLGAVIVALGRFTVWGRQFRVITAEYFNPRRHKAPLLWLALIVLMTLFAVRMNVLFSFWYNGFYTAMQNLEAKAFWFMLLVFAVLATIHVGRALLNYYLQQAFSIRWRIWLTRVLIERWMERVNAKLERWETVKKFTILDHELTVENEGVTANMKIRRSIVTGKYQDLVDAMYPEED